MTTAYTVGWGNPGEETQSLRWVRELYRDLFAETGGVPVPGEASDGALINHPDVDLADPEWNRSGVDWGTLYYKANYARLQRVKGAVGSRRRVSARTLDSRREVTHGLSTERGTCRGDIRYLK